MPVTLESNPFILPERKGNDLAGEPIALGTVSH